jgi:site-specific DNA-methyltransferase (adenine-specific)
VRAADVEPTDTIGDDVRLYRGNALAVLPTLAPGSVDAVVTDPPYGVGFDYGNGSDDSEAGYSVVLEIIWAAERLVRPGGFVVVYQAATHARRWAGWFPREWSLLALPKTFVQGGRGALVPATDYALWWRVPGKGPKPRQWQAGMARDWFLCSTMPQSRDPLTRGHPCPRPLDGVRYIVRSLCPPSGLVLDPFMGSGTTGVAAMGSRQRFAGIEIDPDFYTLALKRLTHATGAGPGQLFGAFPGGDSA